MIIRVLHIAYIYAYGISVAAIKLRFTESVNMTISAAFPNCLFAKEVVSKFSPSNNGRFHT